MNKREYLRTASSSASSGNPEMYTAMLSVSSDGFTLCVRDVVCPERCVPSARVSVCPCSVHPCSSRMAASRSALSPKRTNPYPLDMPVILSVTTIASRTDGYSHANMPCVEAMSISIRHDAGMGDSSNVVMVMTVMAVMMKR